MTAFRDLAGSVFGHLTAIWPVGHRTCRNIIWLLVCDCGRLAYVDSGTLGAGKQKSCSHSCPFIQYHTVHGQARHGVRTPAYKLYSGAKRRAAANKLPFTISLTDIVVPAICPLLGIPLVIGRGHTTPN